MDDRVALLLGIVAALIAGTVIGLAAARLRGPYLAGVTLAVAVVVPAFATMFSGTFKGDQGLSVAVPPPPEALGLDFPVERWQAWLALVAALLVMLLLANLVRSRFGRTFRAVRDNEVAARLAGIHVARTQVLAFVVSAACAGLAGGMFAVLSQSVSPGAFSLTLSLYLLMAIVLGGLGSLAGAVWGAIALVVLPELLSSLTNAMDLSPAAAQRLEGNLPLAIFGLTLIVVMIAAPAASRAPSTASPEESANRRNPASRRVVPHHDQCHEPRTQAQSGGRQFPRPATAVAACGGGAQQQQLRRQLAERARGDRHRGHRRHPPAAHRAGRPRLLEDRPGHQGLLRLRQR